MVVYIRRKNDVRDIALTKMTHITSYIIVLVLLFVTLAYARPQQFDDKQSTVQPIAIISQENSKSDDGYKYNFEAENGIRIQEEATFQDIPRVNIRGADDTQDDDGPRTAIVARGSYSYIAPDGTPINLSYVADQNGFQPVGDHLPTPPPIPEIIQRAIALLPQEYKGENEQQQ